MTYPLRIEKPSIIVAMGDEAPDALKQYVDRLVRLVPAEALAAYQAIHGIVEQAANSSASAKGAMLGCHCWASCS